MFKPFVVASALAFGALSAQAAGVQNDLGLLGSSADLSYEVAGGATHFDQLYHFQLGAPGSLSGSFNDLLGLSLDQVKLVSDGTYWSATLGPDLRFSFDNLPQGYFALYVFGSASGGVNSFSGSMMAQPVPEPESFAMMLAGLGVMGAIAARRRKAL